MATYASVADVTARWDGTAPDERIQAALDDAEVLLNRRVVNATGGSTLAEWIAGGSTEADIVRIVLVRAVLRNLNNPKGFLAEHAGEYGYSYGSTKTAQAAAQLGFTDDDLAELGIVVAPIGSIALKTPWNTCPTYPSEQAAIVAGYWP